ncbi:hypothetical protein [Streptomyces chromofuscus]|uniref:Uncharacterized protein n=1 Tax=Streptomyces chromofuscus TaxID=42881 RepID=A0A7M2THG0_STRCW|nr:hypothetical protein [Streptomyces chromofuscus]QOV47912.1 hypothetical protein IPT68_06220 [Streptomyces chromofuscus]
MTDDRSVPLDDHPVHQDRFRLEGETGYGIFEHGSFGRHDPSGVTGFDSGAP